MLLDSSSSITYALLGELVEVGRADHRARAVVVVLAAAVRPEIAPNATKNGGFEVVEEGTG